MDPITLKLNLLKFVVSRPTEATINPVVTLTLAGEWCAAMDRLPSLVDRDFSVELTLDGLAALVPPKQRPDGWTQPGLAVEDEESEAT
jgi:hypothetical protein